jgi:hypothetical protein
VLAKAETHALVQNALALARARANGGFSANTFSTSAMIAVTQGAVLALVDDVPYCGKSGLGADVEFPTEFDPKLT